MFAFTFNIVLGHGCLLLMFPGLKVNLFNYITFMNTNVSHLRSYNEAETELSSLYIKSFYI